MWRTSCDQSDDTSAKSVSSAKTVQPSLLAKLENCFLSVNTVGVLLFGIFHVKKVQLDNVTGVICNLRASSITSATYC